MNQRFLFLILFFISFFTHLFAQNATPLPCTNGAAIPADNCGSVCIACSFNGYTGSTAGWDSSSAPVSNCQIVLNNDQWFGFIANTFFPVITLTPSNCTNGDGIQLAIFAVDCNQQPIACNGGCDNCGSQPIVLEPLLVPGQLYYLMVDGYNGDICDFEITVSPANALQSPVVGNTPNIVGAASICSGGYTTYSVAAVTGAGFYTWDCTAPGALFNGQPGPITLPASNGTSVEIIFPNGYAGAAEVSVLPFNPCFMGTKKVKNVNLFSQPTTILSDTFVCQKNMPYLLPWSEYANDSGTYSALLYSSIACDSLVIQTVIVVPPVTDTITKYICKGESVMVCGSNYAFPGQYFNTCSLSNGCDSFIVLNLFVVDPKTKILGNTIIGCEQTSTTLHASSSNFTNTSNIIWTKPNGTTQTGTTLLATETGKYKLCLTLSTNGLSCTTCDSVMVTKDTLFIPLTMTNGVVGCASNSTQIKAFAPVSLPNYQWSGPNNFTSTIATPEVTLVGTYTVTVTNPAGCSGTGTAVVTQGTGQPSVTAMATGGPITCQSTSFVTLSATTTAPNATFLWSGPNSFSSNLPSPTTTVAGTYTVLVTDTLGCSNTANLIVEANTVPPVINTTSVQILDCGNSFLLSATATGGDLAYTWTTPAGAILTGSSITVFALGNYKLVVTNNLNGCTTSTIVIPSLPILPIIFTNAIYQPIAGENNGAIDITLNFQTGVTVNWLANGNLLATTEDLSNLSPGTYSVVVTTNAGCTTSQSYTLTATNPVVFCAPSQNVVAFESCGVANNCVNCNLHNYTGSTSGWFGNPNPPGWCGQVQNDQWLAFVAGASNATITVTSSNCTTGDGIQFAVYPYACGSTSVACNEGCGGCGNTLDVDLIPGQTYYLVVDGYGGDECDFKVTASPATALSALPLGSMSAITGDAVVCPNSNTIYSTNTVIGASQYTWSSPTPGVLFNGQPSPAIFAAPQGTAVQVKFPANGNGAITICAKAANACNTSAEQCKSVNIVPIVQVLPTETICASALPFNLPWGATASSSGIYSSVLQAANGCDSTVQQQIVVLNPIADILGNNIIGCGMSSVELQSAPSTGSSKVWSNLATGLQLGTGNNLSISQAGTYVLVVQNEANGKICATSDTVTVVTNSTTIVVMANGGVVGCTSDSLALSSSVAISNIQYAWTGPGGFQSNLPNPTVTAAGDYTLLVSNAQGCSGTATASVAASAGPPPIIVSSTVITCTDSLAQLSASSTFNNVNYIWGGPSGFQSNLQNPETAIAGNYTVTVSDQLGCTNSATQAVVLDVATPLVNITPTKAPCVGVDILTANTTNAGTAPTFLWTGPGGVTSDSASIKVDTAGTYTVLVTNTTNGCTSIQTQNAIHGDFTPQVTLDQLFNPSNGLNNGSINITVSGGIAPYVYTWSTGGLVASTNEDAFFLAAGDYICSIVGADGCTSTVTYTLINTVATQDIVDLNQWVIQPNPSTGIFYLTNKNGVTMPNTLRVFDVLGRSVWSAPSTMSLKEMAIDLTQMPNGVYWLEIKDEMSNGASAYKKIVVHHQRK